MCSVFVKKCEHRVQYSKRRQWQSTAGWELHKDDEWLCTRNSPPGQLASAQSCDGQDGQDTFQFYHKEGICFSRFKDFKT